jgi:hypothetical protein
MGTKKNPISSPAPSSIQAKAAVLVLAKDIHVRPQRGNKFQEISDANQADLEFEVFAHGWMVNVTDEPLGITELQFSLRTGEGSTVTLQRTPGDLANWRLGRLKDELDSWGVRYLQAAQEQMSELDSTGALQGGVAREGWLHYHVQNVTPAQITNGIFELSVKDSRGRTHIGSAKGPHRVPGRVWPFRPKTGLDTARSEDASQGGTPSPASGA